MKNKPKIEDILGVGRKFRLKVGEKDFGVVEFVSIDREVSGHRVFFKKDGKTFGVDGPIVVVRADAPPLKDGSFESFEKEVIPERKKTMKTANQLLRQLRLEAQKNGHVVYNILIRKAGVAVEYSQGVSGGHGGKEITIVYEYWPSLTEALEGEIKEWKVGER